MGISKIYVNNNLKIDLTKTTATAEDVAAGKEFYNKQGDLITGNYTPPANLTPMVDYTDLPCGDCGFLINLENRSLSWPDPLIKDFAGGLDYGNEQSFAWIKINKNSFIPCSACYSNGTNYGHVFLECMESMTYEDVWNCIEAPNLDDYNYLSGIQSVEGQIAPSMNEHGLIISLPAWTKIPRYFLQFNVDTLIVPAEVQYLYNAAYNVYILKCLGETPPETELDLLRDVSYIEVPKGYRDAYAGKDNWSNYSYKIYETGEALPEYE